MTAAELLDELYKSGTGKPKLDKGAAWCEENSYDADAEELVDVMSRPTFQDLNDAGSGAALMRPVTPWPEGTIAKAKAMIDGTFFAPKEEEEKSFVKRAAKKRAELEEKRKSESPFEEHKPKRGRKAKAETFTSYDDLTEALPPPEPE